MSTMWLSNVNTKCVNCGDSLLATSKWCPKYIKYSKYSKTDIQRCSSQVCYTVLVKTRSPQSQVHVQCPGTVVVNGIVRRSCELIGRQSSIYNIKSILPYTIFNRLYLGYCLLKLGGRIVRWWNCLFDKS
jgi:hypothetical protein